MYYRGARAGARGRGVAFAKPADNMLDTLPEGASSIPLVVTLTFVA